MIMINDEYIIPSVYHTIQLQRRFEKFLATAATDDNVFTLNDC